MNTLTVKLGQTSTGAPLATVDGLPGGCAEMTPSQLRALADALRRIAEDADARPKGKSLRPIAKTYAIGGTGAGR